MFAAIAGEYRMACTTIRRHTRRKRNVHLFLRALTCVVCVVTGQQMCDPGQERDLKLVGSAIICIPCEQNYDKGANDATCKMCASETQAISSASTVCVACATDSLFSHAMDPGEALHV